MLSIRKIYRADDSAELSASDDRYSTQCSEPYRALIDLSCPKRDADCLLGVETAIAKMQTSARRAALKAREDKAEADQEDARDKELEAAIDSLKSRGITKDDLRSYFFSDIEEEVRDQIRNEAGQ